MKQPPFACEKTYFIRDVQNWITAHPPVIPWTRGMYTMYESEIADKR